jgi:lysophospholipase L1-like esterase
METSGNTSQAGKAPRSSLSTREKIIFGIVFALVIVALAEVVCRFVEAMRRAQVADYVAQWETQWKGDFWVLKGEEANSDGCRDREHAVDAEPESWRIACLGDSVTMGWGVPGEAAYPSILERELERRGSPAEVFNVSMVGWSARQEAVAYERILRKYQVDDVILGVCLNDIPEMQNNIVPSDVTHPVARLAKWSALVRVAVGAETREIRNVEELFNREGTAHVERGWGLVVEEIRRVRQMLAKDGVRLLVVAFPFRFQVEPGAPDPLPQQRLAAFCREEGIPFIDMLETLRPLGGAAFVDHDHLSTRGNQAVVRALLASGLLQPPDRP